MKINTRNAPSPIQQTPKPQKDAGIRKRTTARGGRAYIYEFETIAVPYCKFGPDLSYIEQEPFLQVIGDQSGQKTAMVLRDPAANVSLSDAAACVPRVYEIQVPTDPFLLEQPSYFGAGGIVRPNETVRPEALADSYFTTTFIQFAHTATTSPAVSFSYDAFGYGIGRTLIDEHKSSISYAPFNPARASAIQQIQSLAGANILGSVLAKATPTPVQKRNQGGNGGPSVTTYTAKVLENGYFSALDYLFFDEILPTATPVYTANPIATMTPASSTTTHNDAPPATILPHVTTVTSFLPNPTNVVQADVFFNLKGTNPNVAFGFANYGAVVGFAALGAVAMVGFAALMRKARTAVQTPAQTSVSASASPSSSVDIESGDTHV